MAFLDYVFKNAQKCATATEAKIQLDLLHDLFHGLVSKEDVASRPLVAQAMHPGESLKYDIFHRGRIKLYVKAKIALAFPNMTLTEFRNLPREMMEHVVEIATEHSTSAETTAAQATKDLFNQMGMKDKP